MCWEPLLCWYLSNYIVICLFAVKVKFWYLHWPLMHRLLNHFINFDNISSFSQFRIQKHCDKGAEYLETMFTPRVTKKLVTKVTTCEHCQTTTKSLGKSPFNNCGRAVSFYLGPLAMMKAWFCHNFHYYWYQHCDISECQ